MMEKRGIVDADNTPAEHPQDRQPEQLQSHLTKRAAEVVAEAADAIVKSPTPKR